MPLSVTVTAAETFPDANPVTKAMWRNAAKPSVTLTGTVAPADASAGDYSAKLAAGPYFYGAGSFSAGVYSVTLTPVPGSYSAGQRLSFKAGSRNTGATSVNVNSLGNKVIKKNKGEDLEAGDILADQIVDIEYDGTNFQMINPAGLPALFRATDAGSADALAITPSPAFIAYAELTGRVIRVVALAANTGSATLQVNGIATPPTIKKNKDQNLIRGDIKAGQVLDLYYDGTNWQLLSPVGNVEQDNVIVASVRNLLVKNDATNPTFKLNITADEVVLKNAAGRSVLASTVAVNPDITLGVAANGLDAGAEAASTWYYIWLIYNDATATVASLLSLSATAPTLPSGYTHKALLGAVRNDGSSNFLNMWQYDRRVAIDETNLFTAKGAAGANTYEALAGADLTLFQGLVPPIARAVRGSAGSSTASNAALALAGDANGLGAQTLTVGQGSSFASFNTAVGFGPIPLKTSQNFYWKAVDTTARNRINISGYDL